MDRRKPEHQSAGRHGEAFWQEEKNNFGLKMMQGMGWSQGKGLGKAEAGQKTFLRAHKKENVLGIGAVAGRDEVWNATRDMYNDLLSRLAAAAKSGEIAAEAPAEEGDKESTAASSEALKKYMAKTSLYGKFKRAKDASNYDSKSMAEILGRKPSSSPPSSSPSPSPERDEPTTPPGANSLIPTTNAGVSIKDYFASKLASKKAGLAGAGGARAIKDEEAGKKASRFQVAGGQGFSEGFQASYYEEMMGRSVMGKGGLGFAGRGEEEEDAKPADVDDFYLRSKKAKEERERKEAEEAAGAAAASGDDEETERKARKAAKKERKRREAAEQQQGVKVETVTVVKVETVTVKVEQVQPPTDDEEARKQKKREKKEKRRREAQEAEEAAAAAAAAAAPAVKDEKKKKKKEKRAEEAAAAAPVAPAAAATEDSIEAPTKQKKKRRTE